MRIHYPSLKILRRSIYNTSDYKGAYNFQIMHLHKSCIPPKTVKLVCFQQNSIKQNHQCDSRYAYRNDTYAWERSKKTNTFLYKETCWRRNKENTKINSEETNQSEVYKQKIPRAFPLRGFWIKRRLPTLPQSAVPSAWRSLTSLFGMERGGTFVL